MKSTKSTSAYTNIWLRRNKHLWQERVFSGFKAIELKTKDAPKKVIKGVETINKRRQSKDRNQLINRFVNAIFNGKKKRA